MSLMNKETKRNKIYFSTARRDRHSANAGLNLDNEQTGI